MINRLVVLGATGDLTARYLLPALAALRTAGHLGDDFRVTGTSREDWDSPRYRKWVAAALGEFGDGDRSSPEVVRSVMEATDYRPADVTNPSEVAALIAGEGPCAVYLALPPALFPAVVTALRDAGLPPGSRIVLEKPFGEDLASARRLNGLLAEVAPEQALFRVDHFLAMTTVQNVLGSRLTNRVLESIWNSTHIERVDIVWDETLALEGRAGYYDGVGALKDIVQNHLLQLLCVVAMEPPITLSERDLRDRKVDVLRSVRVPTEAEAARHTRRARYLAGRIGDREVPSYTDEAGVDPARRTETYAEVELRLDSWRWSGTTFRLRTGKALGRDRKEVAVRFRTVPHLPFEPDSAVPPNVLRFGLEPEGLTLDLTGVGPGYQTLMPLSLAARMEPPRLPAYGRLLLDVLHGDPTLSIRGDEAEESWRVLTPVLSAWEWDLVPLEEYPAGSDGPPPRGD
ncbi:glucose-6-phosphate dehydrogenase [Streptomyces sp. 4N509B]|uniref:glucose-6-phosphate dehydrogenase n=1 Tax=Streptomyces sp. 4N509B TaxID=3457413 RepID=UPI003FD35D5D